MDKHLVRLAILKALQSQLSAAIKAAESAHDAATNEESKAENKYDTRGLEASYLAEGQSRRVIEIQTAIAAYEGLQFEGFTNDSSVRLTAVVMLESDQASNYRVLIGPLEGGLKVTLGSSDMTVVTPTSPLGAAIIGKSVGDELAVDIAGKSTYYELISIC